VRNVGQILLLTVVATRKRRRIADYSSKVSKRWIRWAANNTILDGASLVPSTIPRAVKAAPIASSATGVLPTRSSAESDCAVNSATH